MRKFGTKLGLSVLGALLTVSLMGTAQAQTAVCELDWNCDGVVSWTDVYEALPGGLNQVKSRGFYSDVYYFVTYSNNYFEYVDGGYFHKYVQCGEPGNLDWDGNGVVEMADAYLGSAAQSNLGTFYTQWWVFDTYPDWYSYYYPNSDCGEPQEVVCTFHADCAADEYCAGDGCQAAGTWTGPYPEGVCTKKPDLADCAGEPVDPVCACNNEFYLNTCEMAAAGTRYRLPGICPPVDCPNGDVDCPPGNHCVDAGFGGQVCLPDTE